MKTKQVTVVKLAAGMVMLLSVAKTANPNKVMLEIGEGIVNPNQGTNVLAELNSSDERFGPSVSTRRTWIAIQKDQAHKLGITAEQLSKIGDAPVTLKIENPKLNGEALCIQLEDATAPFSEYQAADPKGEAKQFTKKSGETFYFVKDGKLIYSNSRLVTKESRKHRIIASDATLTWEQYSALAVISVSSEHAIND